MAKPITSGRRSASATAWASFASASASAAADLAVAGNADATWDVSALKPRAAGPVGHTSCTVNRTRWNRA